MINLDSCRCWRCTFCPCKARNKFLVNFRNRTILLCIPCIFLYKIFVMTCLSTGRNMLHTCNGTIWIKINLCYVRLNKCSLLRQYVCGCWTSTSSVYIKSIYIYENIITVDLSLCPARKPKGIHKQLVYMNYIILYTLVITLEYFCSVTPWQWHL